MPKAKRFNLLILVPVLGISLFVFFTIKKIQERDAAVAEQKKEQAEAPAKYRQSLMSQIATASRTIAAIQASEKAGTVDTTNGAKMESEVVQGRAALQAEVDEFDRTNRVN